MNEKKNYEKLNYIKKKNKKNERENQIFNCLWYFHSLPFDN